MSKKGVRGKTGGSGLVLIRVPASVYAAAKAQVPALAKEVEKATGIRARVTPANVIAKALEAHFAK